MVDDVNKDLSYLVLTDPASTSGKAQKARKLGVAVISEEQLIELSTGLDPAGVFNLDSSVDRLASSITPYEH